MQTLTKHVRNLHSEVALKHLKNGTRETDYPPRFVMEIDPYHVQVPIRG